MDQKKFDDQFHKFCQMCEADGRFSPNVDQVVAVLTEDKGKTEIYADWDYYLHTNWAARVLAKEKPKRHVDFGSFVYFSSICSAFIPKFEFYDARPTGYAIPGLTDGPTDLTALAFPDGSIESISCLHVIEHIGLGRYGDKLDAKGDVRAAKELMRVLAPGGSLLFVAPMNLVPRVNFNAHRIYAPPHVADLFGPLILDRLTVLSSGRITSTDGDIPQGDFTGCFEFSKP